MPGKSPKKKYGEFRVFTEWRRRGKWAIRPEFIPSLAAWLLMLGRRYEKTVEGLENAMLRETVPGMKEHAETLRTCIAHIQRLIDYLPQHFAHADWLPAVGEICSRLGIEPSSEPLPVEEGALEHFLLGTPDGCDASGSGADVHPSSPVGESSEKRENEPEQRGRGRNRKKGVGGAP